MDRLFKALRPVIRFIVRRPVLTIVAALVLTALGLASASRLQIDTDLSHLIPADYPSVQALERVRETVGSETPMDVGIESPSFSANQAFAEALIEQAMELRLSNGEPLFKGYEYQRDVSFLDENALYFATDEELDQLEFLLEDAREEARLAANPFFFDLDDDLGLEDEPGLDAAGLEASLGSLQAGEYFVSADSTVLAVRFLPSGAQTNLGFIQNAYATLDSLVAAVNPQSFHPRMEVTTAGRLLRQLVEVQVITNDIFGSFGAGASVVLLLVLVYFFYKALQVRGRSRQTVLAELTRMPVTALLIGIPLLMSLSWTFGVAGAAFGTLNLMSSTLALLLFGLGIDYGIHNYARYTEERGRGSSPEEAAEVAFISTGQAIVLAATTTAASLFVLVLADFRGFSEFGLIGGLGILFALIAMLTVLPAMLVIFERIRLLRLETLQTQAEVRARKGRQYPFAVPIIALSLLAVVVSLTTLPAERFEYDFSKLEPELRAYYDRSERLRPAFPPSSRRNPAYIVVDSEEDAAYVTEELQRRAREDTLILAVESIQERFPMSEEAAQRRLERVAEIRELTEDPFLQADASGQIDRVRRAASTTSPISLEEVPEDLREPFTDREGRIGRFVIVYPAVEVSDARLSMAFADRVGEITTPSGRTYHAGSTSIIAADMLRLLIAESPLMVGLASLLIVLMILAGFGSIRWTALALIPLIVGVLWMLGLMVLFNVPLTFYNLVVLPAVIGIASDCGVHIVHRYREEGPGSLLFVLRSTGEHVSMGAITTAVSFGGLLLSFHPGLHSLGQLAIVGIGSVLLAAMTFLPALLQWLEDRAAAGKSP